MAEGRDPREAWRVEDITAGDAQELPKKKKADEDEAANNVSDEDDDNLEGLDFLWDDAPLEHAPLEPKKEDDDQMFSEDDLLADQGVHFGAVPMYPVRDASGSVKLIPVPQDTHYAEERRESGCSPSGVSLHHRGHQKRGGGRGRTTRRTRTRHQGQDSPPSQHPSSFQPSPPAPRDAHATSAVKVTDSGSSQVRPRLHSVNLTARRWVTRTPVPREKLLWTTQHDTL